MDVIERLKSEGCEKVDTIEYCGVSFDVYESQTSFCLVYEFNGCADTVMSLYRGNVNDLYHAKQIFESALLYQVEFNPDYMNFCWLNMVGGYIIRKYTIDRFLGRFHSMYYMREYNQYELVDGEELESVVDRLPDGALDSFHDPKVFRCFNGEEWHYIVMNGYTWID